MRKPKKGAYGPCHACGGTIVERTVDQPLNVRGEVVIIERVPLGVCTQCGERVSDATTARQMEMLLRRKSPKRRQVVVYSYRTS